MGRKSSFDAVDVYRAVSSALAEHGRVSVDRVAEATGLSMGSLYHRFGSREGLLAETWICAVEHFQSEFLGALAPLTMDAAIKAALTIPRFCREHTDEAIVLTCGRRSEFLSADLPAELRERVARTNVAVERVLGQLAKSIERPLLSCRLALVGYPLGAVRLFMPSKPIPRAIDGELATMVHAVLGID